MSPADIAKKIPVSVYIGLAALGALYVIGRRKGASGGIGDAIGTGIGAVVGNIATGAVKGASTGAGKAVGAVLQAPAAIVDGVGAQLSGNDDFSLGSWFYDLTHKDYDPNQPVKFYQSQQTLRTGAAETNALWGPIGDVKLRAN